MGTGRNHDGPEGPGRQEPAASRLKEDIKGCSITVKGGHQAHTVLPQHTPPYREISQVANLGGRHHVKLSALIPVTKVNVPEGKALY